ncbi:hypothetical protein [Persephonella sp.]
MKYKVSKEELDALFREVYSTTYTGEENYTPQRQKEKEEYRFIAYKYKNVLKNFLVSSIPVKVHLDDYRAYEGTVVEEKNLYIAGYDVEKKFRVYITITERFDTAVRERFSSEIYTLLGEQFNTQRFVENLAEAVVGELKKDFPYIYRKINTAGIQFYDDEYIKLQYSFEFDGDRVDFCVWIEKSLLETGEVSPVIYSAPTSLGKKKLKKLKELIPVRHVFESEPVMIQLDRLREGEEIIIETEFKDKVV